ncbi:uncharacterized protein C8Q71DRAFT_911623 [Rhodofomes roseus]|uniref:Uncharacterized protein n=1 Tax=Rhodofomes roseus TaxID=34475 RepID=A0ABQ8K0U9_9APHY|nr:uncharacterized protein C8Q71DRAFT_911623 [Rhodofomes roseus]KAH9829804.1 hypothetical protein C8Q71DRAFT_911623 [Rhodofomes roseus]
MSDTHSNIASQLTSAELPFFNASATFKNLLVLDQEVRRLRGDAPGPAVTPQGQHNRAAPSGIPAPLHLQHSLGHTHHVLDLDYDGAPSGFAASLLGINGGAHGVGINLRPDATIIRTQFDPFHAQFQAPERGEDVCRIADGQAAIRNTPPEGFDLVLASAALALPDDVTLWIDRDIYLIYAQLLVALQHIAWGGSLVICLPTRPLAWVIDVIAFLRQTFDASSIIAANLEPDDQAGRPLAYVVCHHCRANEEVRDTLANHVRDTIQTLRRTAGLSAPSLSGSAEPALLRSQEQYVLQLFKHVWKGQYAAIWTRYPRVIQDAGVWRHDVRELTEQCHISGGH